MKSKVKVQKEIFKTILNYPDYEISNFGRVKSLERKVSHKIYGSMYVKEKILKNNTSTTGYYFVILYDDKGKRKTIKIHQLVAIAFLNHKPNGHKIVVDHIDNNKLNNNLDNLQLITNRENSTKEVRGTSKYAGVSLVKSTGKWYACICINGKNKNLGSFIQEYDAYVAYQLALSEL